MKYLLDTLIIILFLQGEKLPKKVLQIIKEDEIFISLVSIWEIAIKSQLNKLTLATSVEDIVHKMVDLTGCGFLNVTLEHIYGLQDLQLHHGDPFDRLIISQSKTEGLTVVSRDKIFAQYPLKTIWK